MYCPEAFAENRPEVLSAFIRTNPLGLLVSVGEEGPTANSVPFELGEDGKLRAHLARANPQLGEIDNGSPLLVIFQGEQSYITPSWYATKQQTGKVVPTWNYLMVQVRGTAQTVQNPDWLRSQIEALTHQMEHDRAEPWAVSDAPEKFIAAQLRGIVGIEISVSHMTGKWKAGQNKVEADREGVASALSATRPVLSSATMGNQ